MMVAGAFMSIFLVGALYQLVTVGRAVLYRERMQDLADRAAFEGALGYARSMNEIGLANNVQMVAVANVFALWEAKRNILACAEGAMWGGYPQTLCPDRVGPVVASYDRSVPELVRLAANARLSAEALRDATPDLAIDEAARLVPASGTGERRLVAAGLVAPPMPLSRGAMALQCVRAGPFVRPLIERSSLPADVVAEFDLPLTSLNRFVALVCPLDVLPRGGPQVMDPPNQSGTEALQIRSIVVGAPQTRMIQMRERGIQVPERTIRDGAPSEPIPEERRQLSRVGIAQAEYFSTWQHANVLQTDLGGSPGVMPEENTFYMHWRARLRRLRVPVQVAPDASSDATFTEFVRGPLLDACDRACRMGGSCGGVCGSLTGLADVGNNALQ